MEILNTGIVTLLGTWDFSGATVKEHTYASFAYATELHQRYLREWANLQIDG